MLHYVWCQTSAPPSTRKLMVQLFLTCLRANTLQHNRQAQPPFCLPMTAHRRHILPSFEAITGDLIRSISLRVQGSAGPSGMDAGGWRRICTAFYGASKELCIALAAMTRRICTSFVEPSGLTAFIACRLVPLNKNPGVRPIGICETIRRIVSKAILKVTRVDILSAVGPLQLCAGQDVGCEAAVHAMRSVFNDGDTEGACSLM